MQIVIFIFYQYLDVDVVLTNLELFYTYSFINFIYLSEEFNISYEILSFLYIFSFFWKLKYPY